jgi:hypothetical protein
MAKDKKREKGNGEIVVTEEVITKYAITKLEAEKGSLVSSKKALQDRIDEIDELLAAPDGVLPEPVEPPAPNPKKDKP